MRADSSLEQSCHFPFRFRGCASGYEEIEKPLAVIKKLDMS